MPNTPPKKSARQVPSGERIKQMLTPSMTSAMPAAASSGVAPSSFLQAVRQNDPYNLSDYTPEELAAYNNFRYDRRHTLGGYPIERDPQYYTPGTTKYAMAESSYAARRLEEEAQAARNAELNAFYQSLGMRRR